MIKALKALFLECQLREKLLIVAIVAALMVVWLLSFSTDRARRFWLEAKAANATLATQAGWLAKSDSIDARSKTAIAKLDPAKTYNEGRLFAEINSLGKEDFGNKIQVQTEPRQQSGQFAINSVAATINAANTEADWQSMKKLYLDLQKLSPYINLKELTFATTSGGRGGAGGTMRVTLRATSIEVAPH